MKNLGPEQDPGFPAGFLPRPRHWALLLLVSFFLSAGAKAQEQTVLFDFGRHNGRDGSVVSPAPLLLFYASDWAGPNNTWYSRTGTENFFYDTFGGSTPQKSSNTIAGVTVDTALFDGNDFFTSSFVTGRAWAGLKEFSLSLVFKSNASGSQTQTDINAFLNQRGILGFARGGAGQARSRSTLLNPAFQATFIRGALPTVPNRAEQGLNDSFGYVHNSCRYRQIGLSIVKCIYDTFS
jgi:hypothetical protein